MSQSLISQVERGLWACSGEAAMAIARALGLPAAALAEALEPRGAYAPDRRAWVESGPDAAG